MILRGGFISDSNVGYSTYSALPANGFWFDVFTPTPIRRELSPNVTNDSVSADCIFNISSNSTYINDYVLNVVTYPRFKNETVKVTSLNPSVATVDPNGTYLTGVSGGNVTLNYRSSSRSVNQTLNTGVTTVTSLQTFQSWVSGSLAKNIETTIESLLVDGKSTPIFSTKNDATGTYVYNTNCWAYGLPKVLTSNSVWNSNTNSGQKAGTLISPRHIIFAAHYQIPIGATVRFVSIAGEVIDRVVIDKRVHPLYNSSSVYPDIAIGFLDNDVPSSISYCKILPKDIGRYMPTISKPTTIVGVTLPAIMIDQEEKALIQDLTCINNSSAVSGLILSTFNKPTKEIRLQFNESAIQGDSGSPLYTVINNDPVLLTVATFAGGGTGTSLSNQWDEINNMMISLGGGYTLTPANLSGYLPYV